MVQALHPLVKSAHLRGKVEHGNRYTVINRRAGEMWHASAHHNNPQPL